MKPEFECSCPDCQGACKNVPGWFLPGEADSLAAAMGIPLQQLFDEKLSVNWWVEDDECKESFVLSPAIVGSPAGEEFPGNPHGTCIFFRDGRCAVHTLGKPHECAALTHDGKAIHADVARAWLPHQQQITNLLGREPIAEEFTIFDLLSIFR